MHLLWMVQIEIWFFSIAFTGKHCDVQLACTNKTCHNNGTCIAELTSDGRQIEHCRCTPYYAGDLCEVKLIHCGNASVCGGPERKLSCIEDNSSYYCDCKFGYAGERCEIDLDLCESSPCQNGGTCTDHGDRFTCQCQYGYTSRTCGKYLNAMLWADFIIYKDKMTPIVPVCMQKVQYKNMSIFNHRYIIASYSSPKGHYQTSRKECHHHM